MRKTKYNFSVGALVKRLLKLARSERRLIILATLSSIIGNLAHMGLMGFGSCLVLFSAGKLTSGSYIIWGSLMLVSGLLIASMRYIEGVDSHAGAYKLLANMRVQLFSALRRLAPACLVDREKGDILSIAIADIETIEAFFAHTIGPMFTVFLLPLTALIYASTVHWLFAVGLLPMYVIISVIIPLIAMRTGRNIGMEYRKRIGEVKSVVLETVYGLKDVQIFGYGDARKLDIDEKTCKINKSAHALTMHRQMVSGMPTFFVYLSRIILVSIATYLAKSNTIDFARVIILSFVVSASFSSTQSLITVVSSLLETFAAAERFFSLVEEIPKVKEDSNYNEIDSIDEIKFENVDFKYDRATENALKNLNLTVYKGEKIGIVGESGAGKSTILRLILRFWDPNNGRILVNNTDLKSIGLKNLRNKVAMLEQTTFLYNDTIAANIALGKPTATMDEIISAAKMAGLHDFINTLPDGYETQMGEQGNRLSGGEKQRVGIARIFLINPDIIIMDEPTSNLDVFNEKLILYTLQEGYKDKTLIIVSHRNSTLTNCTKLYKLSDMKLERIS